MWLVLWHNDHLTRRYGHMVPRPGSGATVLNGKLDCREF